MWIMAGNICAFAGFSVLAYISYPGWIAMFDSFLAGFNAAAAAYMLLLIKAIKQVTVLATCCNEMAKANIELVATLMPPRQISMSPPMVADFDNDNPRLY
jgi:hypothetical protein